MEPSPSRRRPAAHALILLVAALALGLPAGRPARGEDPASDGVPGGAVIFFAGRSSCPDGWMPADYTRGRLVVAVASALDVGTEVGTPLGDQEDRRHRHAFSAMVDLPS